MEFMPITMRWRNTKKPINKIKGNRIYETVPHLEHTKCGAVFLVYGKTPVLSFLGMKKTGKHGIVRDDYVCTI